MKRLFRFAAVLFAAISLTTLALAQEPTEKKNTHEGVGITAYLSGGGQYMNLDNLNDELKSINYSQFSNFNYLTGIGVEAAIYNRWIIGVEWDHCKNTASSINADLKLKAEMSGSRTMIRFGYNAVHKEKFNFFPEIGFGGNLINMKTHNVSLDSTSMSFTQAFQTNDGNKITYTNSFINIGAGIDFTIKDGENAKSGCRIGLRAGYMISVSRSWRNSLQDITGPNINPNMFYLKLTIGFSTM